MRWLTGFVILSFALSCRNAPEVSRDQAVPIAIVEASKREPIRAEKYDMQVDSQEGAWLVKFNPKRHGKGRGVWIYIDQHDGSVRKSQFWQ
jgi:hypothetical protein